MVSVSNQKEVRTLSPFNGGQEKMRGESLLLPRGRRISRGDHPQDAPIAKGLNLTAEQKETKEGVLCKSGGGENTFAQW